MISIDGHSLNEEPSTLLTYVMGRLATDVQYKINEAEQAYLTNAIVAGFCSVHLGVSGTEAISEFLANSDNFAATGALLRKVYPGNYGVDMSCFEETSEDVN